MIQQWACNVCNHMALSSFARQVTATTHSQGGRGLELYIDGKLVGQTLGNGSYIGAHFAQPCAPLADTGRH